MHEYMGHYLNVYVWIATLACVLCSPPYILCKFDHYFRVSTQ